MKEKELQESLGFTELTMEEAQVVDGGLLSLLLAYALQGAVVGTLTLGLYGSFQAGYNQATNKLFHIIKKNMNSIEEIEGIELLNEKELQETDGGLLAALLLAGEIYGVANIVAYAIGYTAGTISKKFVILPEHYFSSL